MPADGLRAQVIAAAGSGKTLIGVEVARRPSARRVGVLVPTLDLLTQMTGAWRRGGRGARRWGSVLCVRGRAGACRARRVRPSWWSGRRGRIRIR
ncbi:DEAD/DEAH box helicase family protein [Streptomyces sp. NPDC091280]|uniref:DEAD/DEAH box helicase family protein n=1 Tax=Streptomyces sp. NPDC091280 TaxID=3365984 RepID=UPI003826D43F